MYWSHTDARDKGLEAYTYHDATGAVRGFIAAHRGHVVGLHVQTWDDPHNARDRWELWIPGEDRNEMVGVVIGLDEAKRHLEGIILAQDRGAPVVGGDAG